MQTYYIVASNDLLHFGKGHDDNPPGRGSGRYAWGSGEKGTYKDMRKADKKKVAGNYALLANNISTYNRLSGKELTTEKQIDKFEKAMYAVDTALSNIKQADIDYGTKAVDKAIRNAKITSEVESTGIATLLSAGLTIATGNLWAPIIIPNASNIYKNSKANTAIKESRSKYVK